MAGDPFVEEQELDFWGKSRSQTTTPGEGAEKPLSVSELTRRIRALLEAGFSRVSVEGEISNLRSPSSGHVYFTLKDEQAVIQIVLFRSDAARLPNRLREGAAVVVRGRLTIFEARGQYQIVATDVQARGEGALLERLEALKRKLAAEGLFDSSRKRRLPVFPEKVGLVTSLKGAVIQDFLRILQRRAPGLEIFVRDVPVQGVQAARAIAAAIRAFNGPPSVDVLVIARGGGSLEDLWPFNEEVVARALADCRLPTVSGVGHETDFTIADLAADLRAPTPSAAAELIARDWSDWRREVVQLRRRAERAAARVLELSRERLAREAGHPFFCEPSRMILRWQQLVDEEEEALGRSLRRALSIKRERWEYLVRHWKALRCEEQIRRLSERIGQWAARLAALSPESTLQRGYAIVFDEQGRILRIAQSDLIGKEVRLRLASGCLDACVLRLVAKELQAGPESAPLVEPKCD
ncbi:exodeoxyribonuclease VII large subunit [Methylacidimicrobium tartarophylax]|uniref:Exodeoxyribonuclease 7 large subunit n=1 Tax=Methylacidimicrobium tartarophylax TaxID=1041768 RepID=A0A5E6M7B7_9BACT|nr:exodeoxyribonuclease VII large subunit [Methylacidimicrobium tartarophylax]VVM05206.1 Exodeoxyribonuclease 7 large subunit [Methylacidimicrobium tartarophylax]